MGMYGTLCRISDRQLARITASPQRVASLLSRGGPVQSKPWRILRLEKAWDILDKGLNTNMSTQSGNTAPTWMVKAGAPRDARTPHPGDCLVPWKNSVETNR
jgi:hypothetical protein